MGPQNTRWASYISLFVSAVLMGFKFWAYSRTHSEAIFSDAMESIVNVVAAAAAIGVVIFAARPADRNHPYGHGKAEFFSAAFEGGLITFAAGLIAVEALVAFWQKKALSDLNFGMGLVLAAGIVNLLLGLFLLRVGRRFQSLALTASGHHVLSDSWTSAGVILGLGLVVWTGKAWIDPLVALVTAFFLAKTGVQLVRTSIGGLLDEEDDAILTTLLQIIRRTRPEGIIQVHHCRVIRSGSFHHIDAHAVVPEFWDVSEAHERTHEFELTLINEYPYDGELHLHVDPCRQRYCRWCDVQPCALRKNDFEARRELNIDELIDPYEPKDLDAKR